MRDKQNQSVEINNINKTFAEFLGYKLITPEMRKDPKNWTESYYEKPLIREVLGKENCLTYHLKLKRLNEVGNKILKLGYSIKCVGSSCLIVYENNNIPTDTGNLLNSMYLEYYGFVKWYTNKIIT